jgi:hypothetical protein
MEPRTCAGSHPLRRMNRRHAPRELAKRRGKERRGTRGSEAGRLPGRPLSEHRTAFGVAVNSRGRSANVGAYHLSEPSAAVLLNAAVRRHARDRNRRRHHHSFGCVSRPWPGLAALPLIARRAEAARRHQRLPAGLAGHQPRRWCGLTPADRRPPPWSSRSERGRPSRRRLPRPWRTPRIPRHRRRRWCRDLAVRGISTGRQERVAGGPEIDSSGSIAAGCQAGSCCLAWDGALEPASARTAPAKAKAEAP